MYDNINRIKLINLLKIAKTLGCIVEIKLKKIIS